MTTIAQNFATKASVALVATAMVFSAFAPATNAQSSADDLQKLIDQLMAQVSTLQGQVGQGSTSVASGVCPYTWTRDLSAGAKGADVMKLQQFLNADLDTRVAAEGAGSVGMETEFYGPATAKAVSNFQVKYRADILSPANLVNPTGYFGPSSRAKANGLCVTAPVVEEEEETASTTDEEMDDEEMDEEEEFELGGEGTLDTREMDDASDTDVQEGAEDEVIAELTMEASDGDIEVDRLTFTLDGAGNEEEDPWKVFDTITLWVDGDMIAEFEADDEDNYLDEDIGEFRFSGLGLILPEDEEVEVMVAASVASSVDGSDSDDASWEVELTDVRYFDADGVASDDSISGQSANFDIVEAGDGEELNFSLASSNPDATDILVDTSKTTNGVTVLEYTIEAEEGDIELNTLFVKITTGATSSLVIDEVTLEIDGDTFDAENNPSSVSGSTTFEFDIDGDIVIDEGEEVTVKVMVDLMSQESSNNVARYPNGTSIKAEVTSVERNLTDAEGNSDEPALSGTAVGKQHTLVAEGIVVPVDGFEAEVSKVDADGKVYQFELNFEVTAVEGDFYITDNATTSDLLPVDGVGFTVDGGTATITASLSSTADEDADVFVVREGETETFTLIVTVDPVASGTFRVELDEVHYSTDDDGVTGAVQYDVTPASDFRSGSQSIVG